MGDFVGGQRVPSYGGGGGGGNSRVERVTVNGDGTLTINGQVYVHQSAISPAPLPGRPQQFYPQRPNNQQPNYQAAGGVGGGGGGGGCSCIGPVCSNCNVG